MPLKHPAPPPCPANHLNRFYHTACRLLPEGHEVSLSLGATCVTLRPLPQDWVLAVHHQPKCMSAPLDALQDATRPLPKSPEELEEEEFSILTPDDILAGPLGPWLLPLMKLLEKITHAPPQALFHQAINAWIDLEDPSHDGLHRFSGIVAAAIPDSAMRTLYARKAKGILAAGQRAGKGGKRP